jgi:hypothetical protein
MEKTNSVYPYPLDLSDDELSMDATIEDPKDTTRILYAPGRRSITRPRATGLPGMVDDVLDEKKTIILEMLELIEKYKSDPRNALSGIGRDLFNSKLIDSVKAQYESTTDHDNLLKTDLVLTNDLVDEFEIKNFLDVIKGSITKIGDGLNPDRIHTLFNGKQVFELNTIDLSNSAKLKSIGNSFANNIDELVKVDFSDCGELVSIGDSFLRECRNLKSINLSNCPKLESVGKAFAFACVSLEVLMLSGCENLNTVGGGFLTKCPSLRLVDLRGCKKNFLNFDSFDGIRKTGMPPNTFIVINESTNEDMIDQISTLFNVSIVNYYPGLLTVLLKEIYTNSKPLCFKK